MFSGEDVYRPSFFEMIAADRLVLSLQPSLAHICSVLSRRHPTACGWMQRSSDELFSLMHFALEKHYLANYDASFSENFYGLKRMHAIQPLPPALARAVNTPAALSAAMFGAEAVESAAMSKRIADASEHQLDGSDPASAAASSAASTAAAASSIASAASATAPPLPGTTSFVRPLDSADRRRALFFLVALPYLKSKLDALFVRTRDGIDRDGFEIHFDAAAHTPLYNRLRSTFLRLYPYFHAVYEGSHFVAGLRFLFESSVFYSPWLMLCSQIARRCSMADMMAPPAGAANEVAWQPRAGLVGLLQRVVFGLSSWLSSHARWFVLFSIFGFKFLEWWYSPANAYYNGSGGGGRKLPIPPPPQAPSRSADGIDLPDDKSLCPLCLQERINPAATPTGYVFCYACIHQHVSAHHCCPVTTRPCSLDQLRKIYEN